MSTPQGRWSDLDRPPLAAPSLRAALLAPAGPLARLEVLEEVGSTNAELVARAAADPAGWPAPAVITADSQTRGRGRLGRGWDAPPRSGVAVSLLLRPRISPEAWGWLPLAAGVAVTGMVRDLAGLPATVKWPNDVLVEGRKLCGILVEVVPGSSAGGQAGPAGVVVGVGVNTTSTREELDAGDLTGATSLRLEGAATTDRDVLVRALVRALLAEVERFEAADGDAAGSGLAARAAEACSTLGRRVTVHLPGGEQLHGIAEGLDGHGRLLVRPDTASEGNGDDDGGDGDGDGDRDSGASAVAVSAGDVVHVR
ncbi:BirA family transcriptional regulator, biotin operon repressor / biotin-[acetyl-CoA-carboxylase] ligase [Quadrisphaera granulorum]|uniref:biotin--[biotin carboxyl-carrier protein] ligase n=1 Tax=Quadrisphaera granulorum TaxID=317664 RepID=A0A316A735_9ACTN|nr:biotin--[acetyl-CoA-carboxylase] ligase [Quadrisphaera granulorum]PWJ52790.1 BirA family biotin operon repressor/biotin-[acetyl-CoA-carboxylase] ligase [Quadrisphaera granulorum]SZE97395.1 BirA family transcriptional regulator, biotin operon repressor / biotin-[acetyl-CoA-carboxylase] ligase [Quadrisphaera granulorum]